MGRGWDSGCKRSVRQGVPMKANTEAENLSVKGGITSAPSAYLKTEREQQKEGKRIE